MGKVIVYNQENGIPAVCVPTPECLLIHTIEEIAIKDVPAGASYKIVDDSELPIQYPQEAWEIEEVELNDGAGGPSSMFPEDPQYPGNAE